MMDSESVAKKLGRTVKSTTDFTSDKDFQAFYHAEELAKKLGYRTGSMERNAPIGFVKADECDYISKWRNMTHKEHTKLDGVLLSDDFRNGKVVVVIFNEKEN